MNIGKLPLLRFVVAADQFNALAIAFAQHAQAVQLGFEDPVGIVERAIEQRAARQRVIRRACSICWSTTSCL